MRWKIETNIRFLKYCVGLLNLHSRTDELILQEIYAHLTMFNFCNRVCREIEISQKPGNRYERKIDMAMAIYLCKRFFRDPDFSGEKLIRDIKRYTQPIRPNRADERNLKVKSFPGFPYRIPSWQKRAGAVFPIRPLPLALKNFCRKIGLEPPDFQKILCPLSLQGQNRVWEWTHTAFYQQAIWMSHYFTETWKYQRKWRSHQIVNKFKNCFKSLSDRHKME